MRVIPTASVRRWADIQKQSAPASFSTTCPHCTELVTFSTTGHYFDGKRACVSASARCPGCNQHVGVWSFGANGKDTAEVYMHPNHSEPHKPKSIESAISEPLFRSYLSTVDAYNSGNFVATAVCCIRTLEGLFQDLLPEADRQHNLARSITKVAETVDLAEPIRNLANVLRQGGNLGAHFDMEKEPDQQMALRMLTLLENLMEFLHVLPQEIGDLERPLDRDA